MLADVFESNSVACYFIFNACCVVNFSFVFVIFWVLMGCTKMLFVNFGSVDLMFVWLFLCYMFLKQKRENNYYDY